jgi:aspartyl-tRNA(Asn)/glutamyl-tRNA(Gln) amidotransferase subunit A
MSLPNHKLPTLSAAAIAKMVRNGEVTATAVVESFLTRIAAVDGDIGAYLHVATDVARARAEELDKRRSAGFSLGLLAGVPVSLKDSLVTKGMVTTAGSKMLSGWIPPYDATVVEKIAAADAVVLGKTNCDEFCMGSSTENSAFHATKNPWDITKVPGGSSGGSAAAVASDLCAVSLGSDTGGSIRQPAAFCGTVGIKPTYGRVSRWGLIAYASSLDQIGPVAKTVEDAALMLEVIAGADARDATSIDQPVTRYRDALTLGVTGMTIGLPREYFPSGGVDPEILAAISEVVVMLRDAGANVVDVSLPHTALALPAYYVLAPAEASSNLARYDGVRFGNRAVMPSKATLAEMYEQTRSQGFGPEVKRRIMLGTFALRSGYYDAYYKKSQQVRALVTRDFDQVFKAGVDIVLTPTTPTTAFALGAKSTPMEMYLADVFTLACNLAGVPGLSVPCGVSEAGLPIGVQLMGRTLDEHSLLRVGAVIERRCGLGLRRARISATANAEDTLRETK